MGVLAEFFAVIAQALIELSLWLTTLAAKPIRFLFSRSYRQKLRQGWANDRVKQVLEMGGGSVILVLFFTMVVWWSFLIIAYNRDRSDKESRDLWGKMKKIEQMISDGKKRRDEKRDKGK
jgi:hypothetical protein